MLKFVPSCQGAKDILSAILFDGSFEMAWDTKESAMAWLFCDEWRSNRSALTVLAQIKN